MYTLIDLFSGAGGLSLGFHLSGRFQVLAGVDNDSWALKTFYANHAVAADRFTQPQDIYDLTGEELLSALGTSHVDVLIGGPPCQGFSVAGKRELGDDRNQLVWEFLRLVADLNPTAFVMENVPGLLLAKTESGAKVTEVLRARFERLGYASVWWKLNAVNYGVPQKRKRTFLVGLLDGALLTTPAPTSATTNDLIYSDSPALTVADAFSDLPAPIRDDPQPYNDDGRTSYQSYLREGSTALHNHTPTAHKPNTVQRLRAQVPGTRLYPTWNHSWYKLVLSEPALTVKENHRAPFVHPTEPRVISPRECARLQSFPDRFVFYGTKTAQLKQIGNAVPPLLAKAIAQRVATALDAPQAGD